MRSQLRQIEQRQKQAVDKLKREARKYEQSVNRAINDYNAGVRQHNARVRTNRQKLQTALNQLNSRPVVRRTIVVRSSIRLAETYRRLESREAVILAAPHGPEFLALSESESANSLQTANVLEGRDEPNSNFDERELESTVVTTELQQISSDLDRRWRGAIFALSPRNPDAARHFCTSAREIFIGVLDSHAPDAAVLRSYPSCDVTPRGGPTRRSKIRYLLERSGIVDECAVEFVDEDVENVLELFGAFNAGTHGAAGRYDLDTLRALKERAESGIIYLSKICRSFRN